MPGRKSMISGGAGARPEKSPGMSLSDMRRYLVQTQGKVISIDELRKFVDRLPNKK